MKKTENKDERENHILAESFKQDGIDLYKIEKLANVSADKKKNKKL